MNVLSLEAGLQTQPSFEMIKAARDLNKGGFELIFGILRLIRDNYTDYEWQTDGIQKFRNRTADEIFNSKKSCGCSDLAILFRSFMVGLSIPSSYVELIETEWLRTPNPKHYKGHAIVRIELQGQNYSVDPTSGSVTIGSYKSLVFKTEMTKFGEGLDSWDLGINSWETYTDSCHKFAKEFNTNANS